MRTEPVEGPQQNMRAEPVEAADDDEVLVQEAGQRLLTDLGWTDERAEMAVLQGLTASHDDQFADSRATPTVSLWRPPPFPCGDRFPPADRGVADDVELGAHIRPGAVANRLDEEPAKGIVLEGVAEDIEHLAR